MNYTREEQCLKKYFMKERLVLEPAFGALKPNYLLPNSISSSPPQLCLFGAKFQKEDHVQQTVGHVNNMVPKCSFWVFLGVQPQTNRWRYSISTSRVPIYGLSYIYIQACNDKDRLEGSKGKHCPIFISPNILYTRKLCYICTYQHINGASCG